MIIRGKNSTSKKQEQIPNNTTKTKKGNVIKKDSAILDVEQARNTNKIEDIAQKTKLHEDESVNSLESFEKIDISSIEFKERIERRRGDRRRGYRRIDERSLVTRAQQEAHTIKELAAREGYQNGLANAQKDIESVKKSLEEFLDMKSSMYDEFYPHVMELSMEIAKKIIKKEVETSDEVLKNVVMSVMDEVSPDTQRITIKVNSADIEFAKVSLPEVVESKNISAKVSFATDDTIEKGSCLVLANNGVIDANFKTQLAILQSAFGIYKGGL